MREVDVVLKNIYMYQRGGIFVCVTVLCGCGEERERERKRERVRETERETEKRGNMKATNLNGHFFDSFNFMVGVSPSSRPTKTPPP